MAQKAQRSDSVSQKPDITIFATADWNNPFWTNKQHVAKAFADDGYRVLYIESVGLRAPTASVADAKRVLVRIKKAFSIVASVYEQPDGGVGRVFVLSPLAIPLHKYSFIRKVNRYILGACIALAQKVIRLNKDWLWTYNPLSTELINLDGYKQVIYHCVDAIEEQPGMPKEAILTSEAKLARISDYIFCTSNALLMRHKKLNNHTYYFGNVAEHEHFSIARKQETQISCEITEIKKTGPVLGFVGAISRYKLDFDLINQIARRKPDWQIVLIGKVGEGDPGESSVELSDFPNVHLLGPRRYSDLPFYLKGFDVCILPAQQNEYTRNMFPMKFYEYLMAGKDVVSTPLDSLAELTDLLFVAEDINHFITACEQVIAGETRHCALVAEYLKSKTYKVRNTEMVRMIK